jgi:hypothetical protein
VAVNAEKHVLAISHDNAHVPKSEDLTPLVLYPSNSLQTMAMDYDRNDALLHWLFRQTQGDAWFRPNEEHISSGVALRVNDGTSR